MSRPGPKIPPLPVTDAQRDVLEGWVRRRSTAQSLAQRSRIILACAEGHSIMEVSRRLGVTADMVRTWRRRFLERGLDGLSDEPRPGVPRKITDADVERVIVKTLEEKPKNATHWSTRSMAAATGMSQSTVSRIWRAFALAPHRSQTFKLSTDPLFIDKVRDVVGLYLDPPEKALVLCVDEKSQIQALDRSQPVLPMMPGVPERRSHDYVRAGTTTLFAALEVATGKVIGSLHRRHRAVEFKKFLTKLDMEVPAELDVHLILDNYVTHKTPAVKKWLLAHPRFHLHFTPTSSSWLNLVERWFAELTQKKLKRGVHRSVQALERDIRSWLADWNDHPRPFVWTKTADEILDKVAAYCRRISDSGHSSWPGSSRRTGTTSS
ncbi:IS630 family transposase [Streptomyces althioticus]|uniref:IS630 family transposase n=1 Tax=Streptomyces althioticus TaxID=83380 RepID=UPI0038734758|nr:IS630 family transposase [Streptomyces althioticus]